MRLTRREALKLGLLGTGAALLPVGQLFRADAGSGQSASGSVGPSPRVAPFEAELAIPPVLQPLRRDATTDFYDLQEIAGTAEIVPGFTTPIWGYQGITPGPTIAARLGRPVQVTVHNNVPVNDDPRGLIVPFPAHGFNHQSRPSTTSVHLHGMNTSHQSDGFPELLFAPGESFTYDYPNNSYQRPATLWYHDHAIDITGPHVYRGLAGLYLLTDEFEDALPLPKAERDVPLVLKDIVLDPSGVLVYANDDHNGVLGDVMTVNGRQQPRFAVANVKYRFRCLNASDKRSYQLALSSGQPFTVIGSDQGLLERPETARSFTFAPSERVEVVIDFSAYPIGTRVVLENVLVDPSDPVRRVMAFDVVRNEVDGSRIPDSLRPFVGPYARLDPSSAVTTRRWEFDRRHGVWSINGLQWDSNRIDAFPREGTTEIWELVNKSGGWVHPIHYHLVRFLVLDVEGRERLPGESGWKDTVWLGPNVTVRTIAEFKNFKGRFVLHCHNPSHEDHDMMTQWEVV
jgi:FtsP/CotA-like multicopper oxidase with cupredoxin domain